MAYVALYRKFRPQTFDQVKGQDHIVQTLKNQIRSNRVGHAYLFAGTRGTGKTSVAKILARAVNCLSPEEGEPCGECQNCRSAAAGTFMDIVEVDAASNTGVEDIRRVIEEIQYTPAAGRYKVYIIDEVHMLSMNAFNAFLKTLEEPPEYVIFILATTEPHKLPQTILSRCQRYDFKRIDTETIKDNLCSLLSAEGIEAEEKAVRYIAQAGDGSMRDALSLLDRCVAFRPEEKITYEDVLGILGTIDLEDFSALYRAVRGYSVIDALKIIEKTVESGKDLTPFVSDFIMYLRNLLILHAGGKKAAEILGVSEDNLRIFSEDAKDADAEILMRYIRILSELLNQIRFSASKQILTEVALIKLARPQMETETDAILDRIRMLEQRPAAVPAAARVPEHTEEMPASRMPEPDIIDMETDEFSYVPESFAEPEETETAAPEPAEVQMQKPMDAQVQEPTDAPAQEKTDAPAPAPGFSPVEKWQDVIEACGDRRIRTYLTKARAAEEEPGTLSIYVSGDMAYRQLSEKEVTEYLKQLIADVCGQKISIYVKRAEDRPEIPDQQDLSSLLKNINMNIEMEET